MELRSDGNSNALGIQLQAAEIQRAICGLAETAANAALVGTRQSVGCGTDN